MEMDKTLLVGIFIAGCLIVIGVIGAIISIIKNKKRKEEMERILSEAQAAAAQEQSQKLQNDNALKTKGKGKKSVTKKDSNESVNKNNNGISENVDLARTVNSSQNSQKHADASTGVGEIKVLGSVTSNADRERNNAARLAIIGDKEKKEEEKEQQRQEKLKPIQHTEERKDKKPRVIKRKPIIRTTPETPETPAAPGGAATPPPAAAVNNDRIPDTVITALNGLPRVAAGDIVDVKKGDVNSIRSNEGDFASAKFSLGTGGRIGKYGLTGDNVKTYYENDNPKFEGKMVEGEMIEGTYYPNKEDPTTTYSIRNGNKFTPASPDNLTKGTERNLENNKPVFTGEYYENNHYKKGTLILNGVTYKDAEFDERGRIIKVDAEYPFPNNADGGKFTGDYIYLSDDPNEKPHRRGKLVVDGEEKTIYDNNIFLRQGSDVQGKLVNTDGEVVFEGTFFDDTKLMKEGKVYDAANNALLREGTYEKDGSFTGKQYDSLHNRVVFDGLINNLGQYVKGKTYGGAENNLVFDGTYYNNRTPKEGTSYLGTTKVENDIAIKDKEYFGLKKDGYIFVPDEGDATKANGTIFKESNKDVPLFKGTVEADGKMPVKGETKVDSKKATVEFAGYENGQRIYNFEVFNDANESIGTGTCFLEKDTMGFRIKDAIMKQDEDKEVFFYNGYIVHRMASSDGSVITKPGDVKPDTVYKVILEKKSSTGMTSQYYIGQFANGQRHGRGAEYGGVLSGPIGTFLGQKDRYLVYDGDYLFDKKHGWGKEVVSIGTSKFTRITGFEQDLPTVGAKVKYLDKDNKLIFEGENKEITEKKKRFVGKKYDLDGEVIFDGTIDDKLEYVEGKEFDGEELVYEGTYYNKEIVDGTGKEFDNKGKLIFEGEYRDGRRWSGKDKKKKYKVYLDDQQKYLLFEGNYDSGKMTGTMYDPEDKRTFIRRSKKIIDVPVTTKLDSSFYKNYEKPERLPEEEIKFFNDLPEIPDTEVKTNLEGVLLPVKEGEGDEEVTLVPMVTLGKGGFVDKNGITSDEVGLTYPTGSPKFTGKMVDGKMISGYEYTDPNDNSKVREIRHRNVFTMTAEADKSIGQENDLESGELVFNGTYQDGRYLKGQLKLDGVTYEGAEFDNQDRIIKTTGEKLYCGGTFIGDYKYDSKNQKHRYGILRRDGTPDIEIRDNYQFIQGINDKTGQLTAIGHPEQIFFEGNFNDDKEPVNGVWKNESGFKIKEGIVTEDGTFKGKRYDGSGDEIVIRDGDFDKDGNLVDGNYYTKDGNLKYKGTFYKNEKPHVVSKYNAVEKVENAANFLGAGALSLGGFDMANNDGDTKTITKGVNLLFRGTVKDEKPYMGYTMCTGKKSWIKLKKEDGNDDYYDVRNTAHGDPVGVLKITDGDFEHPEWFSSEKRVDSLTKLEYFLYNGMKIYKMTDKDGHEITEYKDIKDDTVYNVMLTKNRDHEFYVGQILNGKYHGEGKEYYLEGPAEMAYFFQSTKEAKKEREKHLKYQGSYRYGRYHGVGTLYDKDYNGERICFKNICHQVGQKVLGSEVKVYNSKGDLIFSGTLDDDTTLNGKSFNKKFGKEACYIGTVSLNMHPKQGHGRVYDKKNNMVYDGDYVDSYRDKGTGTEYDVSGKVLFKGTYESSKRSGQLFNPDNGKEKQDVRDISVKVALNKAVFDNVKANGGTYVEAGGGV